MREVAKLANVSIGTVSNVINRPEMVAPETVQRVQAAMAELNYEVNDRRNRSRRVLAFSETVQGRELIQKVQGAGVDVASIDLSDETRLNNFIKFLTENKAMIAALLVVTQAGQIAAQFSDYLNVGQ